MIIAMSIIVFYALTIVYLVYRYVTILSFETQVVAQLSKTDDSIAFDFDIMLNYYDFGYNAEYTAKMLISNHKHEHLTDLQRY